MRKSQFVSVLVAAFLAGLAGAWVLGMQAGKSVSASPESTYDRVMRTQTMRCGYVLWTPFMLKDPNTAKLSGIFYDYVESLGQLLHLKIEWTEETTWGDFPAALKSGRFDAMCGGSFSNPARARVIDFVQPILYQPLYVFVRAGDTRFDNNIDNLNDPAVTIITVEGTTPSIIAAHDFPNAKNFHLSEATSLSENFVNLVAGKGDVVILYAGAGTEYDAYNPGKIRRVLTKAPLRFFGNSIAIPGGEDKFRRMLDLTTGELFASGQIEKIITKYDKNNGDVLRVALPYQNPDIAH